MARGKISADDLPTAGTTGGAIGQAALDDVGHVAPIDVLVRMGWLAPQRVAEGRRGRMPALARVAQTNLSQLSDAMRLIRGWATDPGREHDRPQ